jgi:hypothetical protein
MLTPNRNLQYDSVFNIKSSSMSNTTTDLLISLLVGIVFLYLGYFEISKKYKAYRLKKYGSKVIANVIAIEKTNMSVGDDTFAKPIFELRLVFENPKETKRSETIRYAFSQWQKTPKPGDKVILLVDKDNPHHFSLDEKYL